MKIHLVIKGEALEVGYQVVSAYSSRKKAHSRILRESIKHDCNTPRSLEESGHDDCYGKEFGEESGYWFARLSIEVQ